MPISSRYWPFLAILPLKKQQALLNNRVAMATIKTTDKQNLFFGCFGATNVGKTEYSLRILEAEYKNHFEFIVIMCSTILDVNKTYLSRKWILDNNDVFIMCDVEGK